MVQYVKSDLPSFGALLSTQPGPVSKTTSVDKCAEAFVRGIEKRKRRINCPGWVGMFRWLRPLLSSRVIEAQFLKRLPTICCHGSTPRRSHSAARRAPATRQSTSGPDRRSTFGDLT
jgi:hypothetical protein